MIFQRACWRSAGHKHIQRFDLTARSAALQDLSLGTDQDALQASVAGDARMVGIFIEKSEALTRAAELHGWNPVRVFRWASMATTQTGTRTSPTEVHQSSRRGRLCTMLVTILGENPIQMTFHGAFCVNKPIPPHMLILYYSL